MLTKKPKPKCFYHSQKLLISAQQQAVSQKPTAPDVSENPLKLFTEAKSGCTELFCVAFSFFPTDIWTNRGRVNSSG